MQKTSIAVPEELYARMKAVSINERRAMNWIVQKALAAKMAKGETAPTMWGPPGAAGRSLGIEIPPDVARIAKATWGGVGGYCRAALGEFLGVPEPARQLGAGEYPRSRTSRLATVEVLTEDLSTLLDEAASMGITRAALLRHMIKERAAAFRGGPPVPRPEPQPRQAAPSHAVWVPPTPKGVTPAEYDGPRCGNCWAAMPEGAVGKVCPKCVVEMAARAAAKVGTAAAPPVTRPAVVMCAVCKVKPDTGGRLCDDCASPDPSTFGHGEAR